MNGSEAISILGKTLFKEFSISKEPHTSLYKTLYDNFSSHISEGDKKGVLLIGKVGVGKSAAMRVIQKLFKDTESRFKWVKASEFKYLMDEYTPSEILAIYGAGCNMDLYIDDIGISSGDIKKWGNSINIISEIIYERYDLFINAGIRTHLSSNLPTDLDKAKHPNVDTLADIFGIRITDRIKEMCETVIIKGESLRR